MEPTASQVRNHYSQKNQEAHLERVLAGALAEDSQSSLPIKCLNIQPAFEYSVLEIATVRANNSDEAG